MNEGFADWYRTISIEPKSEELQKRWRGVEEFASDAARDDVTSLARVFFGMPFVPEFVDRFRTTFKQIDDTFPMQRNDAELRVLAGATLLKLFEFSPGWDLSAAFSLVCGSYCGLREPIIPAILDSARSFLSGASSELRTDTTDHLDTPDFTSHLAAVTSGCQTALPNLAAPLTALFKDAEKALRDVVEWAGSAQKRQELFREESDILWWIFGGQSRDLRVPFSTLKHPSTCLIAGKELADLVRIPPRPLRHRGVSRQCPPSDRFAARGAHHARCSCGCMFSRLARCIPEDCFSWHRAPVPRASGRGEVA